MIISDPLFQLWKQKEGFILQTIEGIHTEASGVENISARWLRADETFPEHYQEAVARTQAFAGSIAVDRHVEVLPVPETIDATTLKAAAQMASLGDEASVELVKNSVRTDLSERLFKSKNETLVFFDFDGNHMTQNGRRNIDVFGNSLRFTNLNEIMQGINLAEMTNMQLIDILAAYGVLDKFDALVSSHAPTDTVTKKRYGFFDNDAVSLQLYSKDGNQASLHTAFVAGKVSTDAPRHDLEAMKTVAASHGIDLWEVPAEERVRLVLLIPKGTLQNGVTDIAKEFDDAAGGLFYGEAEPRQDYVEFSRRCLERTFEDIVDRITEQLIAEAWAFDEPMDAPRLLNKLSGAAAVMYALENDDINAKIFGTEGAEYLTLARLARDIGDNAGLEEMLYMAMKTEQSASCPLDMMSGGFDSKGALNFECPSCKAVNTRPYEGYIDECQTCKSTAVAC